MAVFSIVDRCRKSDYQLECGVCRARLFEGHWGQGVARADWRFLKGTKCPVCAEPVEAVQWTL